MRFTGEKTAFGRHETFALRFGWLTKGAQAVMSGNPVFEAEDATVRLGVGKNMVASIRYWLQAARIITRREDGWALTPIGSYLFGERGCDPYLEDEATIWLIHWLIVSNPELATSWWWFFNRFHKPEFSSAELASALQEFAKSETKGRHAATTLKTDASVLLRMYVRSAGNKRVPAEEALDSPLSILGLVANVPASKTYESRLGPRDSLPVGILGCTIVELLDAKGETQVPIEELMYGRAGLPAIGAVFRLTESALLAKIERLVAAMPDLFALRDTAGIHQLFRLRETTRFEPLNFHYKEDVAEAAA